MMPLHLSNPYCVDSILCSMVIPTYAFTGSTSQMRMSSLLYLTSEVGRQKHIHHHSPVSSLFFT